METQLQQLSQWLGKSLRGKSTRISPKCAYPESDERLSEFVTSHPPSQGSGSIHELITIELTFLNDHTLLAFKIHDLSHYDSDLPF